MESTRAEHVADAATLERARAGDSDALADLWTIYQPRLLRMLRQRGRSAAEDIASQVWIDVGRGIARFRGDGDDFAGWIFTIATRRAIDESRRLVHRRDVASQVASLHPRRPLDGMRDDSLDGVLALLETLPSPSAEIVMLRVVEDLPVAAVAQITGRSESHVRVIGHRALQSLRDTLNQAAEPTASPDFALATG